MATFRVGQRTDPGVLLVRRFATGDLARAGVPSGRNTGTHTGRVAVRTSGSFNITARGVVQGVHHRHVRLLQRGDGYAYHPQGETGVPQ